MSLLPFSVPSLSPRQGRRRLSPGWAGAPGAMAPLCPGATLGNSSPSSRRLRHPFGPPSLVGGVSLGWDARCPCRVSPGCPRLLGERWGRRGRLRPPRSRPLFWWRFLGSDVTACYFHSTAPTAALRAERGGVCLARSPAPRIPVPAGTARDVEVSLPEISDGNREAAGDGGC